MASESLKSRFYPLAFLILTTYNAADVCGMKINALFLKFIDTVPPDLITYTVEIMWTSCMSRVSVRASCFILVIYDQLT